MGTPDFAVEPLKSLFLGGYNIVGVITMPDKQAGRGMKLKHSPVKQFALDNQIPVLQPEKLKDDVFLSELRSWKADLQIVVAFRMLPEVVWSMPRLGTFNLHASLLPQYRGAAPINWAIINGEAETGITTFFLTHEIDTGHVIFQERVVITDTDNAGIVHDRLMVLGSVLVLKTVDVILEGSVSSISQDKMIPDNSALKIAPKIFKDTCCIDWGKNVKQVYDFIRGLSPYPAAWTHLVGDNAEAIPMKIFQAEKIYKKHNFPIGTVVCDAKHSIDVALSDGFIRVLDLQLAGKKRMPTTDFLRGYKWTEDLRLE